MRSRDREPSAFSTEQLRRLRGEAASRRATREKGVPILLLIIGFLAAQLAPARASAPIATDDARRAGVFELADTWSANVGDLDADGWKDVLLVRHFFKTARLYHNNRGHFSEIDAGTFSVKDRHDCAWGDVDQDGLPDVYCTIGACRGTCAKRNELWMQQPDHTFINRATEFGVTDPYGRGRWSTFLDVNHDAYPDLYVGNGSPRRDSISSPARLFINVGGSHFRDAEEYGVNEEIGSRSVQAVDFDRDGWSDLIVCGESSLFLYRNELGARFTDVAGSRGVPIGSCQQAMLVDLDGDGWRDLIRVRRTSLTVQLQATGFFGAPVYIRELVAGTDVAAGDINRDSRPDIYVVQGDGNHRDTMTNSPDLMLLNNGSGTRFSTVPIPQARYGRGQSVAAIDYNRNGRRDFLVLNGATGLDGPIQLISFWKHRR